MSRLSVDDTVAAPGLGVQSFYGFEEFGLAENLSAAVNLSNGNLVVRDTDLAINGPGIGLRLDRFYNGLSTRTGAYGQRWSISGGQDVGLEIDASQVIFRAPSGFRAVFTADSGGAWTPPAGLGADLVQNTNGTWKVTYRANGEVLTFTAGGYLTSDADRNGNALTFAYTTANEVASVTDAAGRVTSFTYTDGTLTRLTDPADRTSNFDYTSGMLTSSSDAANHRTSYRYDSTGRLDQIRTPRGSSTTFGYDSSGRVTSVTKYTELNSTSGAQTTTFAYAPSGSGGTTVQTNPLNQATAYTWDTSGRITQTVDALGRTRSQTWTPNSSRASTTDAMGTGGTGGNIKTYSYDAANNPTQVALPTGAATKAVYSPGGTCGSTDTTHPYQAKCATDDAGRRTSFTYSASGNILKAQDTTPDGSGQAAAGVATSSTYQGTSGVTCGGRPGQVCSTTNGNAATTTFSYDATGNMVTATAPAPLGASSYGYDTLGRITSFTDGKAQTTTYGYDMLNHRTRTTVQAPAGQGDRYAAWGVDGNQTGNHDELVVFDAQNRAYLTFPPASAGAGWELTRDVGGNIISANDNVNRATQYTFDAAGQLTALAEFGGTCPTTGAGTKCTRFTYDNNGNVKTTTFPGGTVETTTRDNSGRTIRIRALDAAGAVLSDLGYSYTAPTGTGPAADRTHVQDRTDYVGVGGPAGSITRYTYDSLARLLTANETTSTGGASAAWSYTYDDAGNRLSQVRSGNTGLTTGTTTYGYNTADQLTSINGSTDGLSYDANGNQTASPGMAAAGIPASTTTVNTGDQITNVTTGSTATPFTYNGTTNTNRTSVDSSPTVNTLLGLEVTGRDDIGTTVKYIKTPSGDTIGRTTISPSPVSSYFLHDNLGSVVGIVDATGTMTASYAYDPYGITRVATGTAAAINPLQYTGGYLDATTGLIKLGARYYDPTHGRFTQPDPSGIEANLFAYAVADPINRVDPKGLQSFKQCARDIVVGAVGGGIAGAALGLAGGPFSEFTVPGGFVVGSVTGGAGGVAACGVGAAFDGVFGT